MLGRELAATRREAIALYTAEDDIKDIEVVATMLGGGLVYRELERV